MKVPKGVNDLYLDLRDKRLLPLVILLVAMLVAIPFLLGGGAEAPPPPASSAGSAAAGDAESAAQLTPFVTSEVPGIREFDKRLDSFQRRNPFKQQLTGPSKGQQKALEQAEDTLKSIEDSISAGGADLGGGTDATSTGDAGTDGSTGDESDGSGGGGGGKSELILYTVEIDVKVGQVGDAKKLEGVKDFAYLPGKKRPIVQYVQGSFDETAAGFVVSRAVSWSNGEGRCDPGPKDCQFLKLEVGEEQRFKYEPDGKLYRLKLTGVHLIEERVDPDDFAAATESAGSADRSAGLRRLAGASRG